MSAAISGESSLIARAAPRPAPSPRVRVRAVQAGCRTLARVSGPLPAAAAPALEEALHAARRRGAWLILDLRAVDYIESPPLRLLLALADELPARGGRLCLVVQPDSRVARTLRLGGLGPRCPVFASAREAWTARPLGEASPAAGTCRRGKSRRNGEGAK